MALALMHNTLGRLGMDFLIWHSSEFNFIQLPDRLSVTSSISPQMRIPYVLEFVHGTSGLITGRLMGALAIKNVQCSNRWIDQGAENLALRAESCRSTKRLCRAPSESSKRLPQGG